MLELDTNEKMKELVNLFLLSANPDIVAMGEDFKRGMFEQKLTVEDVIDYIAEYLGVQPEFGNDI